MFTMYNPASKKAYDKTSNNLKTCASCLRFDYTSCKCKAFTCTQDMFKNGSCWGYIDDIADYQRRYDERLAYIENKRNGGMVDVRD